MLHFLILDETMDNSRSRRILQMCNIVTKPKKLPNLNVKNALHNAKENDENTNVTNNEPAEDSFNIMDLPIDIIIIDDSFLDPACSDQENKIINNIHDETIIQNETDEQHDNDDKNNHEDTIIETETSEEENRITNENLDETIIENESWSEEVNIITNESHDETVTEIETCSDEENRITNENHDENEINEQRENDDDENSHNDTNNEQSDSDDLQPKRKKRKLGVRIKKVNQELRMKGKQYLGYRRPPNQTKTFHDCTREARSIGPSCTASFCVKSKKRMCNQISEENRKALFTKFWNELTWDERKIFVCNLVSKEEPRQRRNPESSETRRNATLQYFIKVNNIKMQVCKKMFLSTFGLGEWQVKNWVDKSEHGMNGHRREEKENKAGVLSDRVPNQFMKTFLENLNKLPSHYCRKDTQKMYLEQSFQYISDLYKVYVDNCKNANQEAMCSNSLTKALKKMNISLYQPKKDQCDICSQYEEQNLDQDEWERHTTAKDRAREEKGKDKEEAIKGTQHVLTCDLQAVKVCPSLMASSLYFKLKLCTHNFTVYNLSTNHSTCYWFDETQSDLQASTFASFIVDYIKRHLNDGKPIIIYSDGCTYQNRNSTMANALLHLAQELNIDIQQKFLVKGHTQMECDSVHATIEKRLKNRKIFLPSDYARLTEEARTDPEPYEVKIASFDFFKNFNDHLIYTSIRPGKKTGDATVIDIRALLYSTKGVISYKLNFDEEYKELPHRPKQMESYNFNRLHQARLKIKKQKYDHLQQLKAVIPQDCWQYYDNLPYL